MAAAINRITGALCFNNGDSAEERLREFLAVCGQDFQMFYTFSKPSSSPVRCCAIGAYNGPFPSVPKPLFQSEAKCEVFDMKMIYYSHANKTHFYQKGFALSLAYLSCI